MATTTTRRTLQHLARRPRPVCDCATTRYTRSVSNFSVAGQREESKPNSVKEYPEEPAPAIRPRWSYTPERMKAPVRWRIKDPDRQWVVNDNPHKLDQFYVNLFGRGGEKALTEEVKWLAITHKSFEQGARGFNDRLAYFGRRIITLQTNLALIQRQTSGAEGHWEDPALQGLDNLAYTPVGQILTPRRLGGLATQMGMREIMRWVPKQVDKLDASGIDAVLTTSLYAIVGALALQRGGKVAAEFTREKIVKALGI